MAEEQVTASAEGGKSGTKSGLAAALLGAFYTEREPIGYKCGKAWQAYKARETKGVLPFSENDPDSYRTFRPVDAETVDPFQRIYDGCMGFETLATLMRATGDEMGSGESEMHTPHFLMGLSEVLTALKERVHDAAAFAQDFYNCDAVTGQENEKPKDNAHG